MGCISSELGNSGLDPLTTQGSMGRVRRGEWRVHPGRLGQGQRAQNWARLGSRLAAWAFGCTGPWRTDRASRKAILQHVAPLDDTATKVFWGSRASGLGPRPGNSWLSAQEESNKHVPKRIYPDSRALRKVKGQRRRRVSGVRLSA